MMKNPKQHHWSKHSEKWSLVTSPLRPSQEDISIFKSKIKNVNLATILLGVTPELQNLSEDILVIDNSTAMLKKFVCPNVNSISADWKDINKLKLNKNFDLVIGDGCLNVISFKSDLKRVLFNLHECLLETGKMIIRVFIKPEIPESIEEVISKAYRGLIPNFSAFKWHFAMAVAQDQNVTDIPVRIIYDKFINYIPDFKEFAKKTGWSFEEINTISHYQSSKNIYNFPSLDQIKNITEDFFDIASIDYATYYFSDRCPIITFRKKINDPR